MIDDQDEYRMLADHIIDLTNPADDDVAEVSIVMDAVTRLHAVVAAMACTCPPGTAYEHGMDEACARCQALGRFGDVGVDR